jgi:hypothetical protein
VEQAKSFDSKDFKTPENIEAARLALDAAQTKAEVVAVFNEYFLKVGHKVLGRLLLGRDPLTGHKVG